LHDSEGFEPGEKWISLKNGAKPPTSARNFTPYGGLPLLRMIRYKTYVLFRICISVPVAGDRVAETGVEHIIETVHGRGEFHVINSEPRDLRFRHAVPLIVVFTKYDFLVTRMIRRAPRGGSTEEVWENAEREANKEFEVLCVDPFVDEVLNKKVPNANRSVPIKKVSGRLMSPFDISCADDGGSLRYP
jgi:hypothetical protein